MPKWQVGLLIAVLSGGATVACGKKDDGGTRKHGTGGSAQGGEGTDAGGKSQGGEETATGGRQNQGGEETGGVQTQGGEETGGVQSQAGTGNEGGTGNVTNTGGRQATGGNVAAGGAAAGAPGAGGEGTGGVTTTAGIDDLIETICTWEFGCCNEGELSYRLGTSGGTVQDCIDDFVFQLHSSNQTHNPYPAGTATGLLGTLGFTVNLDRVVENPTGIQECIDAWNDMSCATSAEPATHCAEAYIPGEGPCSLVNLFDPGLSRGDRCTLALTEADGNDVECPAGTTCVDVGDPDNPENFPTCVQRGTDGDPCTNDGDCDWNFYCNGSGDCTEKGDEGDDCSFKHPSDPVPDDEAAQCKAGLKCNPNSKTCVSNCSRNYPCASDFECPDGDSCRPRTVGDDATSWHTCQAIGTDLNARCDDNADCVDTRRCDGGNCAADLTAGQDCTTDEECEAGSFCDLAELDATGAARTPTEKCTAYFDAQDPCFPLAASLGYASGCDPNSAPQCVFVGTPADLAWECRATLRQEGDTCYPLSLILADEKSDCEPDLSCEYTTETATEWTCTSGAEEGDDCDDNFSDGTALNCGVGLFCDVEAVPTPECVAQLDPGSDCEDPHNAGSAQPLLCKNNACVEHWDGNGSFICTDAPVPLENEGDGLTCNGN